MNVFSRGLDKDECRDDVDNEDDDDVNTFNNAHTVDIEKQEEFYN